VLLYRVFPYLAGAAAGQPGHADFLFRGQGHGRWDNPAHYLGRYLAGSPSAAVGEVFGHLHTWGDDMLEFPAIPDARRAIGTYALPDDVALLDFDNANALAERSLRPTEIVSPNRSATQKIALDAFIEAQSDGAKRWAGLSWWSSQRSFWPVHIIWGVTPVCQQVDDLDVSHSALQDAAKTLSKTFV